MHFFKCIVRDNVSWDRLKNHISISKLDADVLFIGAENWCLSHAYCHQNFFLFVSSKLLGISTEPVLRNGTQQKLLIGMPDDFPTKSEMGML